MRYQFWQDHDKRNKLPIVFKTDPRPPHDVYYLHWHKAVEIILISKGQVQIKNNEQLFDGKAGELYIIHSTHLHSFQTGTEHAHYYCLIVPDNIFPTKEFFLAPMPYVTGDPSCIALYQQAYQTYIEKPPYYEEAVQGLLLQLYARLAALGGSQTAEDTRPINTTVRQAMRYIEQNYASHLNIQDIADALGISRHHLCHIFKQVTGTTPAHYWQNIRCDAARKELRHGASVAEAAEACGFSSYPYFAKIYRQKFGIPPSEDKIK